MADMFRSPDAVRLLKNKTVLFLGDSNLRALYKDVVWFLQNNTLTPDHMLKIKSEKSHAGDAKVRGDHLHKGRDYIEDRSYINEELSILVEYSFTSLCYSKNVIEIFRDIKSGQLAPDVIIMNSTLWDITRWGPRGIDLFKENMVNLMKLVSSSISPSCLFLWLTALPVSSKIKSSLLIEEIKFLQNVMRFNVLEANNYARQIVGTYGYDVLDFHYYCRMQLLYMKKDGVHFQPILMRYLTNLILTHCSLAWNKPLPGNVRNRSLLNCMRLPFIQDDFKNYIDVESMLNKIEGMAPNRYVTPLPEKLVSGKPATSKSVLQKKNNAFEPNQGYNQNVEPFAARNNRKSKYKQWYPPRPAPYQNNYFRGNSRYVYRRNP